MPLYEYICSKCNHEFEELSRSMSDRKPPKCPLCGSGGTERRLSVFAARQDLVSKPAGAVDGAGCGRCGNPHGPCAL